MKLCQLVLLLQISFIGLVNTTRYNFRCPRKCGNVTIHYPFGTQEGCYLDKSYYIECDPTTQVPRLNQAYSMVLNEGSTRSLEVLEVNPDGHLIVNLPVVHACYNSLGKLLDGSPKSYHMSRFPFSSTLNTFVGFGWYIEARIKLSEPSVTTKCLTYVFHPNHTTHGSCLGFACCKSVISQNMTYAHIAVSPTRNTTKVRYSKKCAYAFLVDKHKFDFNNGDYSTLSKNKSFPVVLELSNGDYSTLSKNKSFPVVLELSIGNTTCEEARKDKVTYGCQDNSVCINGEDNFPGYRCKCQEGYVGNAYIQNGCQDVNECESPKLNHCLPGYCKNTYGSYTCDCPKGHHVNERGGGQCTHDRSDSRSVIKGISEGVAGAALTMVLVYLGVKLRRKIKVRKDFFKQNGGIMLQEILFTCKDTENKMKIFTEEELKKATDNFKGANVIGQGGYGTVYKGILTDKTVVAIKKSKVLDQSQVKQFVNEVIILSKINHPNIIKLLGCCLETHVPLLVYEYVTNNTLCYHIHTNPMLTLEQRLKISEDTAEALSYMHSTLEIIHRDVKPSNILLNDDFTAKVSDFGISTFVPPGETHLSTLVKGTIGYVDPEYFRTSKLTEKIDVYSFGVVLIELLTGKDVHSLEISLTLYSSVAAYLVLLLEQNALVQVLDDQLKRYEYTDLVKCVAKLAISCLELEGKKRPTMNEIKQELSQLRCLLLSMEAHRE